MANLIYSVIASLDGYVEDRDGRFDWAAPDEEVHAFVNDLERPVETYLYGRRMYETMVFWESPPNVAEEPPVFQDYARIWQSAEKIVFFEDAGDGHERKDPDRARLRPGRHPPAEGGGRS